MTLPASGTITSTQIVAELGHAAGTDITIPSTEIRELTGVAAGSIVWPNDFWGKSHVNFTYHENRANTSGSFTGIDIGAAATDRRVFIAIHWTGSSGVVQTVDSGTINGVAATIHTTQCNRNTATSETVGAAIMSAIVPTGTSVNVSFVLNFGSIDNAIIGSFRAVNLAGASPTDTDGGNANQGTKPVDRSVNVPEGGLTMVVVSLSDVQTITATGPSTLAYERSDVTLQAEVRYQTLMSADASFAVSGTWASGDHGMALAVLSWDMV